MIREFIEINYKNVGANISQIQVLASVLREMVLSDELPADLDAFINLPLPKDFSSWEALFVFCKEKQSVFGFRITSDMIPLVTYYLYDDVRILDYSLYRTQAILQRKLGELLSLNFERMEDVDIVRYTDSLKGIYISLCVDLGNHILHNFFEEYDPRFNFKPVVVNLEWIRRITGTAEFYANLESTAQKKEFENIYKVELLELACQCRYLSFWICLLQFIYCPSLPKDVSRGFFEFAFCLLQKHNSLYIHHVLVENCALDKSKKPKKRDARDNTTRIKLYFTFEDGEPLVARFDLPHKGMNSLHLNIQDYHHKSQQFDHYKFALNTFEHDLLEPLEQALCLFDYKNILHLHAGPESDHLYLQRVSMERAVFGFCGVVWSSKVQRLYLKSIDQDLLFSDYLETVELSEQCKEYLLACNEVLSKHFVSKNIDISRWSVSDLFNAAIKELWCL